MSRSISNQLAAVEKATVKTGIPEFRSGDAVRVHVRIVEGNKERIQVFEGVVIKRHKGNKAGATFTVRKVSYNIGVERTFLLHSPRIEKIEVLTRSNVRRARLFYLRPLRGKSARIKGRALDASEIAAATTQAEVSEPSSNGNGNHVAAEQQNAAANETPPAENADS